MGFQGAEGFAGERESFGGICGVMAKHRVSMQAGLTTSRLTFREIFSSTMCFLALRNVTFVFFDSALLVDVDHSRLPMAA